MYDSLDVAIQSGNSRKQSDTRQKGMGDELPNDWRSINRAQLAYSRFRVRDFCVFVVWDCCSKPELVAPSDSQQSSVLAKEVGANLIALCIVAGTLIVTGLIVDRSAVGAAISRALDRVTLVFRNNADLLLRVTCSFFFVAQWTTGGTFFNSELKAQAAWILPLQLGVTASLILRRTSFLAGLGILLLYTRGINTLGIFHVSGGPIVTGLALCLIIRSRSVAERFGSVPLAILRYATAATLMWAPIEKWADPERNLPVYVSNSTMGVGWVFDPLTPATGVIEFTLAFALLWTPLVRRAAAFVLLGMFTGAIVDLGKTDIVSDSVIDMVLLLVASDDARGSKSVEVTLNMLAGRRPASRLEETCARVSSTR